VQDFGEEGRAWHIRISDSVASLYHTLSMLRT
jgi:hypothetical protein